VSEHTPAIDFGNLPAPSEGFVMTQFITVRSVARSRAFYSEVLGGQVVRDDHPVELSCALTLAAVLGPAVLVDEGSAVPAA
jgi:hypothetical protein